MTSFLCQEEIKKQSQLLLCYFLGEGDLSPNKCLLPRNKTSNVHICKDFFHCEGFFCNSDESYAFIFMLYTTPDSEGMQTEVTTRFSSNLCYLQAQYLGSTRGHTALTDRFAWDFVPHAISFALPWSHFNLISGMQVPSQMDLEDLFIIELWWVPFVCQSYLKYKFQNVMILIKGFLSCSAKMGNSDH